MPTFPTYDGELPSCLNPWNPRHYLLVLYWVYFRPTALKCYLHQADSELYRKDGSWKSLKQGLHVLAYRNLWIMAFLATVALSVMFILVGGVSAEIFKSTYHICPSSLRAPVLLEQSTKICRDLDMESQRLTLSYWIQWLSSHWLQMLVNLALGVGLGVGLGAALASVGNVGVGIIFGVVLGVAFGVTEGVTFGLTGSIARGLLIGLNLGVASGISLSFLLDVGFGTMISVMIGVLITFVSILARAYPFSVTFGIAFSLGALRLPFYAMQFFSILSSQFHRRQHPLNWDELGVLPFPRRRQYLLNALNSSTHPEIQKLIPVYANQFQVSAAQQALVQYIHNLLDPISFFFQWSLLPQLSQYTVAPRTSTEWRSRPPVRQVIFAELNHQFISLEGSAWDDHRTEKLIYNLTKRFRNNTVTPLTDFAGIFYRLFTHNEETDPPYDLLADRPIYTALTAYPYGTEIAESFETIAQALTYDTLESIATAESPPPRTDNELRPTILQTLHDFHLVRQEIHTAIIATSNTNRLRSIALANDRLDQLQTYITETVPSGYPEHKLLLRITRQWQKIITQAGGTAARQQLLTPVSNPYVAGNPVTGKLFVGRDDILQRIEELWTQPDQISSIVLYGHRRMGKTSILRNLPGRFGPHTHIIDFNLQRVGMIDQLADLIYRLAIELHDALPTTLQTHIPEPTEDQYYNTNNPTTQLDRLLKQIQTHRQTDRFILAIDEFEILEDLITQGKIEPTIIAYLRALIQTYPWFILIFAGLHTLQEMTENYWNPLFGSVTRIPVSTLSPASAYQLITNPTDDFLLDYDQDAIDRIIQLSGGQPYLTQLLCQSLITRFNRIRFEERREIEPRFTLTDVETIVSNPDFYRDGNAYFSALWDQATETHAPTQHLILRALTQSPLKLSELTHLIPNSNLQSALQTLLEHDVIALETDRYTYRVELLRLWVQRSQLSQ
jgi:hypothetical protein